MEHQLHSVGNGRSQGRAHHSQRPDQEIVQHHIQQGTGNGHHRNHFRLLVIILVVHREGTQEVDVVAESFDKKKILIGECKWTEKENASRLLYELEKKARLLPFVKDRDVVYALFLKHKPDDDMENVILPEKILTINN